MAKRKRAWKKVNYSEDYSDYQCAVLALMGFSTHFIETETGLTANQVNYRIYSAGILRRDYRDGGSPFAQLTLNSALSEADKIVQAQLNMKTSPIQ